MPYCAPEGITLGQRARVIVKYLRDHPKDLNLSGGLLAMVAMNEAYPYPKAKPAPAARPEKERS